MGVPCAPVSHIQCRVRFLFGSTPFGPKIRARLSRERLSRIGSDSWEREPNPCHDLKREIESKGCLISDFGIVSSLRCPILKHNAGRVLHNEGRSNVEQIQRPVGLARGRNSAAD
jgi:hypothetical protein